MHDKTNSILLIIIINKTYRKRMNLFVLTSLRATPVGQTKSTMALIFSYCYIVRVQTIKQCICALSKRIISKQENQRKRNL